MENNIDLLNIDLVQMKKNIVKECRFDDISFNCSIDDMKNLLNQAIEIETEEKECHRERGVYKKKSGDGMYISIKNIHISLDTILQGLSLMAEIEPISILNFLYNLFSQLRINIDKWQMAIYIVMYEVGKKVNITDENLIGIITNRLVAYGYGEQNAYKIMDTVNGLYDLGLIDINNGIYVAVEKIHY